ncbi:MAG: extracellular solute-binding protein [Clostridia bacterium]
MKKARRGAWALLILTLLLALFLGGCKDNAYGLSPKDPESLIVWHYYNGAQKAMFDQMVTLFNETVGAEKGIAVEAYSQGAVDEVSAHVMDAIQQNVGASNIPDIFAAYADAAYDVNQAGMLAEIGQYLTPKEREAYVPAYIEEGSFYSDKLYIMPVAKSTEVLILNETDYDAFQAATGVSDAALETWEGLAQTAQAYYAWTDAQTPVPDDGKAFFGRDAMANHLIIGSLQLGAELLPVENNVAKPNLNRAALRRIWDTYYVPYISGYYASIGRFRSDDAKTGDIIALVGSTSGASYFPHNVTRPDGTTYPITARVLPLPNFEGTTPYAVQQGAGMAVTKSTPKREYAATVFLKWFTQPEQNLRFCVGSGYLPVQTKANRREAIDAQIDSLNALDTPISPLMADVMHVGVDTVMTSHLYTGRAFEGGTQARDVVNSTLQNRAQEDRAGVLAQMAQGMSHADAVALYNTDARFDDWVAVFSNALAATIEDATKGA